MLAKMAALEVVLEDQTAAVREQHFKDKMVVRERVLKAVQEAEAERWRLVLTE
jgi:hypothetical protein